MPNPRLFRFGVVAAQARSGEEWIAKARRAEAFGFSTLLMPDTLGPTYSPFPALAVAAAVTRTLRVGSFVLNNDYRNPVLVARESATLDALSGGRFELGIGAGRPGADADYAQLGMQLDAPGTRIERLAESLTLLKAALSGKTVAADGPHYTGKGITVFPKPVQEPRPPILVAGGQKRVLSLAAREADIVAFGVGPDETGDRLLERIGWMRAAAEERVDDLELSVNLLGVGSEMPFYVRTYLKLDPADLAQIGSPLAISGDLDAMCAQLITRRERFGLSYIMVADELMEAATPVVEQLTGR
jgi:probable F420-dependent oxidoreductase